MVILDTSVIIDHLRLLDREKTWLEEILADTSVSDISLSAISIQELYAGKSTRNSKKEEILVEVLSGFEIWPYTYEIAQRAGEITRDLNHSMEFADSAIAATAIVNSSQLATLNTKDFRGIKGLELL